VLDGIYPGPSHDLGSFVPLSPPETEDVARVLAGTARRILRIVERRGLDSDGDSLALDDPLLAMLTAASIRSRIATGPEADESSRRLGDRVEPLDGGEFGVESEASFPPRCLREGGMSLHADVAVPANDRKRLERLCRYAARPPLALDRLEAMADGRLAYRLKTRWRDGTTHVVMEQRELLERLAPYSEAGASSCHRRARIKSVITASWRHARDRVVPSMTSRTVGFVEVSGRPNLPLPAWGFVRLGPQVAREIGGGWIQFLQGRQLLDLARIAGYQGELGLVFGKGFEAGADATFSHVRISKWDDRPPWSD
jgi:hypothetical protein